MPVANTNLNILGIKKLYTGKVREIYAYNDDIIMISTDRISAFDHILPRPIPEKGSILNQVAKHFLIASKNLVPNWLDACPHPYVSIGKRCKPIKIEMVIRGYLAGHAWREYKAGKRIICGVTMPEGMKENDRFPQPIITPATKADEGHDEDISKAEILSRGIVSEETWNKLEKYTRSLFDLGTKMAAQRGLILVDTKYEFGMYGDQLLLIDEVHTPDSSRYFYAEDYDQRQANGTKQKQLSKEFVREWLMDNGFQGKEGDIMPSMTDDFLSTVTDRYIELYEKITGQTYVRCDKADILSEIENSIRSHYQI